MKRLILLVTVLFALSSVASAAIITNVDRAGGKNDSGGRDPIGPYTPTTAPLASDAGGLADGVLVFSDRTYPYVNTPDDLLGPAATHLPGGGQDFLHRDVQVERLEPVDNLRVPLVPCFAQPLQRRLEDRRLFVDPQTDYVVGIFDTGAGLCTCNIKRR